MAEPLPVMTPVKSSNVEAIGHDATRNEMHVQFKNGGHYVYQNVPADLHANAVKAESIGKFLTKHVKGKFEHAKR